MRQLAEVAPGILVATGQPYTTTSTVVIGPDGHCLVIDPAITAADVRGLAGELAARGLRADVGWATHPHWDHVLWCQELGDVPRYAAPAAALAAQDRAALIEAAEQEVPGHDLELLGLLRPLAADHIPWHGPSAELIVHDAHEAGHGAVFLPESRTLVAGDMVSDVEIPLLGGIGADAIGRYRAGLAKLASLDVRVVVPGHGHVGDAAEFRRRVAADVSYLDDLEAERPSGDGRISGWLAAEHERQGGVARI